MPAQPLPAEPTLDEIRLALAPAIARNAAFDGWSAAAIMAAALEIGVDADVARLAYKDGAMSMIDGWIDSIDLEVAHRLPPEKRNAMKIRERITALLATRMEIMAPDRESLRRAMGVMAMPQNLAQAAMIGWRTADRNWRLAGDAATDFNHYTKRMTLTAVYASLLVVFVNDDSEDFAEARAFLDRRIENVMQFEKAKAQAKARTEHIPSLSRFIGRLRYPPR